MTTRHRILATLAAVWVAALVGIVVLTVTSARHHRGLPERQVRGTPGQAEQTEKLLDCFANHPAGWTEDICRFTYGARAGVPARTVPAVPARDDYAVGRAVGRAGLATGVVALAAVITVVWTRPEPRRRTSEPGPD